MTSKTIYPISKTKSGEKFSDDDVRIMTMLSDDDACWGDYEICFPDRTKKALQKALRERKIKYNSTLVIWEAIDTEKLINIWPNYLSGDDIFAIEFPRISQTAIDRKAFSLQLSKTDAVKESITKSRKQLVIKRNKEALGRNLSYEFAKQEIKKFSSMSQLYKQDNSLYQFITKSGFRESLCAEIEIAPYANTSYPQLFMYECLKFILSNREIILNDRKAIYPKEIDIYIPELKLGFEYNGVYWHKNDEIDKTELCREVGVSLHTMIETNKTSPENGIIEFLNSCGLDTSEICINDITERTHAAKFTVGNLKEFLLEYKTRSQLKEADKILYNWLIRKDLFGLYAPHIVNDFASPTKEEIINILLICGTKFNFYTNYKRHNSKFCKLNDPELNELYNMLETKRRDRSPANDITLIESKPLQDPREQCLVEENSQRQTNRTYD